MHLSRRHFLAGLSVLAVTPVLGACGGEEAEPAGASTAPDSGGAEAGAFPVTIEHKYGSTQLDKAPTRVVCVGLVEQDALLALGVVPVGVTKWFGEAPGQIFPWATAALGDGAVPTVLDNTDGVPVEKVAALAPDLIIGQYAGLTEKEYGLLSKLAPTIAQPGGYVDYGVPWDEATLNIGKAVGRPAAATALVSEVTARIEKEAAAHPEFKGLTAAVVTPYEGLFVYGPEDPRGRMLAQLGFTFPEVLLKGKGTDFGWSISSERTSDLADLGAVVWLDYSDIEPGMKGVFEKTKAFDDGRYFDITDGAYYIGHSMVTPLSIPYVLDRYVPQLAAAIDGDPATKPPAATD